MSEVFVAPCGVTVTLDQLVAYDPESGALTWKERPRHLFESNRGWRVWNTRHAGKPAFSTDSQKGYLKGMILGRRYYAHRIVWALVHGSWPQGEVDHIDGVRNNNRIENLRDVAPIENRRNQARRADNTSGVCGVHWNRKSRLWDARIFVNRETIQLGSFTDIEAAKAARKAAEVEYGFHPNHGRV